MFKRLSFFCLMLMLTSTSAWAQTGAFVRLQQDVEDTIIDSTTDELVLVSTGVGSMGSVKVQTVDSYTGSWQVLCTVDGTNYDPTPLQLQLVGSSTLVTSVSDTVGIWDVINAAGCYKVKFDPTAGFSGSDTRVWMRVTQTGGGGGGGGGAAGAVTITDGVDTATVTAGGLLQVECATCSGSGVQHIDNAAFTGGTDDVVPFAALFDTTPPTITDGRTGNVRMNTDRYLYTVFPSAQAVTVSGSVTVTDGAGSLNTIVDSGTITAVTTITNPVAVTSSGGNFDVQIGGSDTLQVQSNSLNLLPALAQNASTSGQVAALIMGAVTTAAPSYTNAQSSPLSLDTSGGLRVSCPDCTGAGAAQADNTALGDITGAGFLFDATPPSVTDGFVGMPRMDSTRYLYTVFPSAQSVTATNAFALDATVTTIFGSDAVFGTAGSADADVLTVQGVASMTPLASNLTQFAGSTLSASNPIPMCVVSFGGSQCQTLQSDSVFDLNTTGTTNVIGYALAIEGAGGPQAISTNIPLPVITTASSVMTAVGNVAHDGVDSGNPNLIGYRAISHGTNPTAVAAADRTVAYANIAGIPFSGIRHPAILTREWTVLDADGAQTGTALVDISAGTKIVVLYHKVTCDFDNTADVDFRMAFDTDATFAAAATTGTAGIIDSQAGIPAGGGSIVTGEAVGGDGEDVRYSLEDPAGGACRGILKYYTIAS